MSVPKWGLAAGAVGLLALYNGSQPGVVRMRTMDINREQNPKTSRELAKERYGPSLEWLDRVMAASSDDKTNPNQSEYSSKLDFRVLSSLMVAGLASGFKSQVANLLWMKSDEYWHQGLLTRQNPLMELVVTLDPQFIDAWSTAGWHWAYNIYADVETNTKYKDKPKVVRQMQGEAIATGLGYLKRGSEMNPEKYRLWFEHGWTRAEKAGYYDDETVALYRKARSCRDARDIQKDVVDQSGKPRQVTEQGLDILGRTIGHLYENVPQLDKALDQYGRDLLKMTAAERAGLDAAGKYWGLYSSQYAVVVDSYQNGDATIKAQIKNAIPDIEQMVAAHQVRNKMQTRNDQPTGAYISLTGRYLPAWRLMKAGNLQGAVNTIIGVMNSDPKYSLQGLPRLAKVMEIRGDAPAAIQAQLQQIRKAESLETQEIGLHFLATLYERMGARETDAKKKLAYNRLAYDTWYRARLRKSLNFYARTKTLRYEDRFGFKPSKEIAEQIQASRKKGTPDAAPALPPNVELYYEKPHQHSDDEDPATHAL